MTVDRARVSFAALPGVSVSAGAASVVAQVPPEQWESAARLAKDSLGCAFFSFLTAVDWKADGLEIVAWVDNLEANLSVQLRTKLGAGNTTCASITGVYRGADWMERECFDMFGVQFPGHPGLRRILLGDDWEGHPLLKSYAVDTPHPPYR